jgi:hypothetical protein
VQIDGVEFCEREKTQKNRQQDPHSFEHITSHPLVMGIYSISANYYPHDSLSNGIIIIESFLTNTNILVTKVGRIGKNPISGTSCGRGLKMCPGLGILCVYHTPFLMGPLFQWAHLFCVFVISTVKHTFNYSGGQIFQHDDIFRS